MILLRNTELPVGFDEKDVLKAASRRLGVGEGQIGSASVVRLSLDARHRNRIRYEATVCVSLEDDVEKRILSGKHPADIIKKEENGYVPPATVHVAEKSPVIVGFGPAGMFCALILAGAGLNPIVLERGEKAEDRKKTVEKFMETGELDPDSNVQFGEGGAGTFSDGKLYTGINDPRTEFVLRTFAEAGAGDGILIDARPHMGTDVLVKVVTSIRKKIEGLGGKVLFGTVMESYRKDGGTVCVSALDRNSGRNIEMVTGSLILATGHSSRDTFQMLLDKGLSMVPKPFSMGVRIEHSQEWLDGLRYGKLAGRLPHADYRLSARTRDGRGVYTFCMCPGGYVIAAASEPGMIATNGMSNSGRDGRNCNSALLVSLAPEDFPYPGPLGGMEWQRDIEKACFKAGGGRYRAPAQLLGDFIEGKASTGAGTIAPTYRPGVVFTDLGGLLPDKIKSAILETLPALDAKLPGFSFPEAVLTAPETRSSSPVRILRDPASRACVGDPCIYPCGEGAGYAGGIMSAAVDGIKTAEAVIAEVSGT
ncbi:MAG: NAD(P)/FAD-dependent oxidoreductase [Oscillospiraceae bacterium]|jgi:uncharacterized FAD-dependent dehydrogenase